MSLVKPIAVGAGLLGLAATIMFLPLRPALAEKGKLVVAAWGGQPTDTLRELVAAPFQKETGISVVFTSPPDISKLKAMVQAKNVEWDVSQGGLAEALALGQEGLLDAIDYAAFDPKDMAGIDPKLRRPYWVAGAAFTEVMAFRRDSLSGKAPQSWADFFDASRFPGPRAFRSVAGFAPPIEQLLLADGVAPDKLYPPDIDRAFRVLERVRPTVGVWWNSWQQPFQLLGGKEVVLTPASANRIQVLQRQDPNVDFTWSLGNPHWDGWMLPNGGNRAEASKFLAYLLRADVQAARNSVLLVGAANSRADEHLTAEQAKQLNTAPENVKQQVIFDEDWWAERGSDGKTNRVRITERWEAALIK